MTEKLLKVNDLQEYLQLSKQGIYKMLQEKKLPKPLRIGNRLRWRRESIEEFLQAQETEVRA